MPASSDPSLTTTDSLANCALEAKQHFTTNFGKPAQFVVAAPGRVNLIGEHVDYNDGFVLPMAIERYVVVAASIREQAEKSEAGNTATFHSGNMKDSFEVSLDEASEPEPGSWSCYIKGVIVGFLERGCKLPSFDAVIQSSVPLGGGLSSSAALEVAVATLLEEISGTRLEPVEKAILSQQAEHRYAGVPCGIMDQYCSVCGQEDQLLLIDCQSREIKLVPFDTPDVTILITNSNVSHQLGDGEYAKRRQECEVAARALGVTSLREATLAELESQQQKLDKTAYQRALHVFTENERTLETVDAFRDGRWEDAGELMYASHESLRDNYEVSCKELNILVELAREIGLSGGVFGSRMTGGGFGGCTVSLIKTEAVAAVAEALRTKYQEITGIKPSLFASRPARGAHVIRK